MKRKPQKPQPKSPPNVKYLLAGGTMLVLVGVLADVRTLFKPAAPSNVCQEVVQSQSVLSRDELARLLNVPERDTKEAIRAIVSEPYCLLPNVEIRAGVTAEREAYPLAFDPQTWFVVLYEGNEYAGYSFVFQR
ncbi:hypothetical protein H6G89_16855 [Oscillatoria sp. FACHB-1407]|uniref:hypothetical protein n=1 Tax=Oscillatoria sp. FACHB-1407 TaxID=2692847 RepID=UPI001687F799|nr:hypothetical protein [Oscillatoria sp. FACHB-1407]MBD2462711.1 hypothetical protein [Oscillatoria sp. FACHB-1407]